MAVEKIIRIEEWKLIEIENVLRLTSNMHKSKDRQTSFDRCVCDAWHYAKEALNTPMLNQSE